jgi:hypothetical protein
MGGHSHYSHKKIVEQQETGISHEDRIIQIVSESGFRIVMMNAAAPKRDTPAAVLGTVNAKNHLAPPCLKRGPEAGSTPKDELLMIFSVRVRTPVHMRFNRISKTKKKGWME